MQMLSTRRLRVREVWPAAPLTRWCRSCNRVQVCMIIMPAMPLLLRNLPRSWYLHMERTCENVTRAPAQGAPGYHRLFSCCKMQHAKFQLRNPPPGQQKGSGGTLLGPEQKASQGSQLHDGTHPAGTAPNPANMHCSGGLVGGHEPSVTAVWFANNPNFATGRPAHDCSTW